MRKGFTLIELMIVVAIIAVIAAIAIPNLVASKMASNETAAVASLRTYLAAQNQYHRSDFENVGFLQYAVPFPKLHTVGATVLKLIDLPFSLAVPGGPARAGFVFDDLLTDAAAGAYDPTLDCGLAAAPKKFNSSGRNIYVMDVTGVVYQKLGVVGDSDTPVTAYPAVATWIAVGSEG